MNKKKRKDWIKKLERNSKNNTRSDYLMFMSKKLNKLLI